MDNEKFQYEGMKWLFELELLNHPQVINTIKFNILGTSKRIKEVELLIYRETKSMLVLLDLSWLGRKFFKDEIFGDVHEISRQLLPSFRIRVIDDPEIMKLAISQVKQALTGGKNENANNGNVDDVNKPDKHGVFPTTGENGQVDGDSTNLPSNSEEPSKTE